MNEDWNGLGWAIDVAAAVILTVAAAWSASLFVDPLPAVLAGAGAMIIGLATLRLVPDVARFRLPGFSPLDWDQALPLPVLEVDSVVDHGSGVVQLFPARPSLPTAAELSARIDRHLEQCGGGDERGDAEVVLLSADATAALRHALQELKRSMASR